MIPEDRPQSEHERRAIRGVEIAAGVGVALLCYLALTITIGLVADRIFGARSTVVGVLQLVAIPVSIAITIGIRRGRGPG